MTRVLGQGQESNIKRWIRCAQAFGKDEMMMSALQEAELVLPVTYVYDNPFLLGGAKKELELSNEYKVVLLRLLRKHCDANDGSSMIGKKVFQDVWCVGARGLQAWAKTMEIKFKEIAKNSLAFKKVIDHCKTKAGIEKCFEVQSRKCPLHGRNDGDCGIKECRAIYLEMERCHVDGRPPPEDVPTYLSVAPPHQSDSQPEPKGTEAKDAARKILEDAEEAASEAAVLASLAGPSNAPQAAKARIKDHEMVLYDEAVKYLQPISVCADAQLDLFKENARTTLSKGRCILVSDFRTSVKSVISESITLLATIASSAGHDKLRLLTFLGPRLEILGDFLFVMQIYQLRFYTSWADGPMNLNLSKMTF